MKRQDLIRQLSELKSSDEYKSLPIPIQKNIDSFIDILKQETSEPETIINNINNINNIITILNKDSTDLQAPKLYALLKTLQGNELALLQNDIRNPEVSPLTNLKTRLQQISLSPAFDLFLPSTKDHIKDIIESSENMINENIFRKLVKCSDNEPNSKPLHDLVISYSYVISTPTSRRLVMSDEFVPAWSGLSDQQREEEETDLKQSTAQAQTDIPKVEDKKNIQLDKVISENLTAQEDFSIDYWQAALEDAKKNGREAFTMAVSDAKLALNQWLASNNFNIQGGKILVINSTAEANIKNAQIIVKFNNTLEKYDTLLSKSKDSTASLDFWIMQIKSIDTTDSKHDPILAHRKVLLAKRALDQWLTAEKLKITDDKILIQSSGQEARIANATAIIELNTKIDALTNMLLDPPTKEAELKKITVDEPPPKAEEKIQAPLGEFSVEELKKNETSAEPKPKRIIKEPIIEETKIFTLTQDEINNFIQKRKRGFDGILLDAMPMKDKIEKLQAIVNNFEEFLQMGGFIFKANLFEKNIHQSKTLKKTYDLTEVEKCYNYFIEKIQVIREEQAEFEATQVERLQETKAQVKTKQIEENNIFSAMTPTKQLEYLKNLATKVPFASLTLERERLLANLNPDEKYNLLCVASTRPRKMLTYSPNALNSMIQVELEKKDKDSENKWNIWLAQQQMLYFLDESNVKKTVHVDQFLLSGIKQEIIDTNWKFPSKFLKQKKNKIEHQIGNMKKTLYAPEHIVQIFNIISKAEQNANKASNETEANQIWANAIKEVADVGDKAKPSSSVERFFSKEKGDPRANKLYQNLGLVYQEIEKSTPSNRPPGKTN